MISLLFLFLICKILFVNNNPGINHEDLKWMYEAAKQYEDYDSVFNRVILLDEMSIQEDLQVVKWGEYWELVGAVDLGPLVNDLEAIDKKKKDTQLASHCFQYMY